MIIMPSNSPLFSKKKNENLLCVFACRAKLEFKDISQSNNRNMRGEKK